jgi:hypothetical protein
VANYEQALAHIHRLSEHDPNNTLWLRDMTVTMNKLGDAKSESGDNGAAVSSYTESLAVSRGLAERDPSNALWQSDLWFALYKLSEAKLSLGDTAAARGHSAEGLTIIRSLAAGNPADTRHQLQLLMNLYRLGSLEDGPERESALKEALAILERLQAANQLTPDKIGWPDLIREMLGSHP